jgi:hypothetical protein
MPTRTVDHANTGITPFKGRDIYSATIVFVYRNLHHNVWSIRAADGPHKGEIVGHAKHLVLDFARWRVNELGRQRVIRDRAKNVHAGVFGMLADIEPELPVGAWSRVTYNPYGADHFYLADIGPDASRVDSSRYAMFDIAGKAWAA